jgi:hypothetical protein
MHEQEDIDDPPVIPSPASPTKLIKDQNVHQVLKTYSYQKNWEKSLNRLYFKAEKGELFVR